MLEYRPIYLFFFFNDTATTEIYTLSLHDALPICGAVRYSQFTTRGKQMDRRRLQEIEKYILGFFQAEGHTRILANELLDRKSTRLNSSHSQISYAVFCLKKKKKKKNNNIIQTQL